MGAYPADIALHEPHERGEDEDGDWDRCPRKPRDAERGNSQDHGEGQHRRRLRKEPPMRVKVEDELFS